MPNCLLIKIYQLRENDMNYRYCTFTGPIIDTLVSSDTLVYCDYICLTLNPIANGNTLVDNETAYQLVNKL